MQRIIAELIETEYLSRTREGRRNRYEVDLERTLRCPIFPDHMVSRLTAGLVDHEPPEPVAQGLSGG